MFTYIIYRLGQFIALSFPLKLAYRVAIFVSDLHYIFADKDRLAVANNLKAIFPRKSNKEIRKIRLQMTRNFAKYLVDFFRFSKLDLNFVRQNIKLENLHYFDEVLSEGKGAIVLSAHLRNWELGGVVVALLGYPIWAVALPHKDKQVDNFFNYQRESKGMKVIPTGRAVRQCLNLLKENKIIALVGDRDFSAKGIIMDFFDKPTFLPEGAAAFSLKTGAAIVPAFMYRNEDDSFTLRMEKPLRPKLKNSKIRSGHNMHIHDDELRDLISQYKTIIEGYIRRFPDQWYMFRKFWKDEAK